MPPELAWLLREMRRLLGLADQISNISVTVHNAARGGPTQICGRNPARINMLVFNNGAQTIYVGGPQVTIGQLEDSNGGVPIAPGAGLAIDRYIGAMWAVSSIDGQDVRVQEWIATHLTRGELARIQT